jgi:hypothetical protein
VRRSVLIGSAVFAVFGLTVGLQPMGAAAQPLLPRAGLHDPVATTRQFPDLHAIVRWTENDIRETAIAPVTQALIVSTTDGVAIERGAGGTLGSPNQVVDVILLQGKFTCPKCSVAAGSDAPRADDEVAVWLPGTGVEAFGIGTTVRNASVFGRPFRLPISMARA